MIAPFVLAFDCQRVGMLTTDNEYNEAATCFRYSIFDSLYCIALSRNEAAYEAQQD